MAECIEREAVLRAVQRQRSPCRSPAQNRMLDCLKADVIRISAADVAPVVHGRWIEKSAPARKIYFECSHCGAQENKHTAIKGYYCWRCGAKMDGGADHEAD